MAVLDVCRLKSDRYNFNLRECQFVTSSFFCFVGRRMSVLDLNFHMTLAAVYGCKRERSTGMMRNECAFLGKNAHIPYGSFICMSLCGPINTAMHCIYRYFSF